MYRNLLIAVAIFGLGWGASFGAGIAVGKRSTPAVVQAAGAGAQTGQGQNSQGGAALAGQGAQSRVTLGTVSGVSGQTLTVSGQNGQDVKVNLTGQTQITKQAAGSPADLTNGTRVTVQAQGQPAADGTITAASVNIVPEGAAVFAQGQQGGQGGQRQNGGQRPPGQTGG